MKLAAHSFKAFALRELMAGRANRSFIVFPVVLLLVGLSPALGGEVADTAQLYLLQVLLYLVPLFSIIAGTSAAQADAAEDPLLCSLPVPVYTRLLGKFAALALLLALALFGLFLPALIGGAPLPDMLRLWGYGAGIAWVFLALGLMVGFHSADGVRAHLTALALWIVVTFGFGMGAWLLASSGWAQDYPTLWMILLGASPLEALRVAVLFSVEAVPFSPDAISGLGQFWIGNPGLWFSMVSLVWLVASLAAGRLGMRPG